MMQHSKYPKGFEWRKWDLHIHSPYTFLNKEGYKDCTIDNFVEKIAQENIKVVGLTNYFRFQEDEVEKIKEKLNTRNIVVFPNLEFRVTQQNKDGEFIHIHMVFSEKTPLESIKGFLTRLPTINGDYCIDLSEKDIESTIVGWESLFTTLKAEKKLKHRRDYLLIACPRGQGNFRPGNKDDGRGKTLAKNIDKKTDILFGNSHDINFYLNEKRFVGAIKKPVVYCSDAHTLKDIGKKFTWIKADPTFEGLTQIIYEPENRVFIGEEPEVLKRVMSNKTKYIKCLKINQKEDYKEENGIWFKNVNLEFSKELVAIIGNKGSGKSAIADILALLGNTRKDIKDFSFLQKNKFKTKGYAENFEASILWENEDAASKTVSLNEDVNVSDAEKINYLPQQYFEGLTNSIGNSFFEETLKNIIFSHIPESQRLGKSTFNELEEQKKRGIEKDLNLLKSEIKVIASSIEELQDQKSSASMKKLQGLIENKKNELTAHLATKPEEIQKPIIEKENEKAQEEKLRFLNTEYKNIIEEIEKKQEELKLLYFKKEEMEQIKSDLERFLKTVSAYKNKENEMKFRKYGFDINNIIEVKIELSPIVFEIKKIENEIKTLEDILGIDSQNITSTDSENKKSDNSQKLLSKKEELSEKIKLASELLSKPEKDFHEYQQNFAAWEKKKKEIEGSDQEPNTLKFYEARKAFVINDLPVELSSKIEKIVEKSLEVFNLKKKIIELYEELKKSIDAKIEKNEVFDDKFKIEVAAGFKLSADLYGNFMGYIDKRNKSSFKEGDEILKNLFEGRDLSQVDNISKVLKEIISLCNYYKGDDADEVEMKSYVKNTGLFYEFVFFLDYLEPVYELRFNDKTLEQLSPGEKGALLLAFYLMIDKDDIPLVIDQPEDNLDNKTVFEVLTCFIKGAKRRRQIIMVTHNPNLAVGADAEQIIYVALDKNKKYKFSYETGSIENSNINGRIVEILEGTMPAFDKRRLKYKLQKDSKL